MKNKNIVVAILAVAMLSAILVGCNTKKEPTLTVVADSAKQVTITANKADSKSAGALQNFVVGENEKLVFDEKMDGNHTLTIKFLKSGSTKAELTVTARNKQKIEKDLEPGTYTINVTPSSKAVGTVVISLEEVIPEPAEEVEEIEITVEVEGPAEESTDAEAAEEEKQAEPDVEVVVEAEPAKEEEAVKEETKDESEEEAVAEDQKDEKAEETEEAEAVEEVTEEAETAEEKVEEKTEEKESSDEKKSEPSKTK